MALSERVIGKVFDLLKQKGIKNLTVDLSEGYDEEGPGLEHYRLKMVFGEGNEGEKVTFSKHYMADTGEGLIGGIVRSKVSVGLEENSQEMAAQVAEIYIKGVEDAYPEWKNQWEEGKFDNLL